MFTLPSLPYDYSALEPFIDEETMHLHHDKHHQAYIDNLNKALEGQSEELLKMCEKELLMNLNKVPENIRTKVRNNAGGHANHSMFWKIMIPHKDFKKVSGDLKTALDKTFGDFKTFQEKFTAAAMGRFGSGWAWLVSEKGKLSIMDTPNQDSPLIEGKKGILGLDVWEHAFYLKYKNMRADYIKAWWNVVNWPKVEEKFAKSKQ